MALDLSPKRGILAERQMRTVAIATPGTGAFRNGASSGVQFADFDQSIQQINSFDQGSSRGLYSVRAGDTLASIAAGLWGDASLWYVLAEANGLSASASLSEGQSLVIPPSVVKSTHTADTFAPYDPAAVLGDVAPTTPHPPKAKKGCGAFGQIILAVIAIAVVIATSGGLAGGFASMMNGGSFGAGFAAGMNGATLLQSAAMGAKVGALASGAVAGGGAVIAGGSVIAGAVAGGAIAGAAGSIVSQGVGVATGIQDKFSWNAVALSAIGGGVGGGMGLQSPSGWGQQAANAAAQNIVTQSIGRATGLQENFSWAGVAASAVGSFVRSNVSVASPFDVVRNSATLIADAATRSLIEGSDFGDNVLAALPNVVGQTIGEAIAGGIAQNGRGGPVVAEGDAEEPTMSDSPSKNGVRGAKQVTDQDDLLNYLNRMNDDGNGIEYRVQDDENPWTIARDRLGPNATDTELDRYVSQIMKANPGIDPERILPGTPLELPRRPGTIIFIGGGGEGWFNNFVRDYREQALDGKAFPYETAYFQEQQVEGVLAHMNEVADDGPIILVGHSYGTSTAIEAASRYDGIVAGIIAVDPVAKLGWRADSLVRPTNVVEVVRVNGIGYGGRNDQVENTGLLLGGGVPRAYLDSADVTLTMRADHGDFRRMFETRVAPSAGVAPVSARDLLFNIMRNTGTPIFNAQQAVTGGQ